MAYKPTTKRYGCIYMIVNIINNKVYIGQSVNYKARKQTHKRNLINNCHDNPYLQSDFNLYGLDSFKFVIIEDHVAVNELLTREDYWIEYYGGINSDNTYNQENSQTLSETTKQKISENIIGANNGMYGKHHTSEVKRAISEKNTGNIRTKSTIYKWRASMLKNCRFTTRQHVSKATALKISKALKQYYKVSDEKKLQIYNNFLACDNLYQLHEIFNDISVARLGRIVKEVAGSEYNNVMQIKRSRIGKRVNPGRPQTAKSKEKIRQTIKENGGRAGEKNGHYGKRKYSEDVVAKLRREYDLYGDYKKVIELNPQVSKYAVKYLVEYGIPYKPKFK